MVTGMSNQDAQRRNDTAIGEFKETRALALAGAVDAVSSRAIGLRLDLASCMDENAALKGMLASVSEENTELKAKLSEAEAELTIAREALMVSKAEQQKDDGPSR